MMIQPVFKILSTEKSEGRIITLLAINPDSEIFKGHFPEQPVVPGACMLQTVKEVLEDAFNTPIKLAKADNIKFINIATPDIANLTLSITYQLLYNDIKITAELKAPETLFMKLQGSFTI